MLGSYPAGRFVTSRASETLDYEARPVGHVSGTVRVPGDKSISHRSLMLAALAEGVSEVRGFLASEDCLATLNAMRALGVSIEQPGATHVLDPRRAACTG